MSIVDQDLSRPRGCEQCQVPELHDHFHDILMNVVLISVVFMPKSRQQRCFNRAVIKELLLFRRRVLPLVKGGRALMSVVLSPEFRGLALEKRVEKLLAEIHGLCRHRQRDDLLLQPGRIDVE